MKNTIMTMMIGACCVSTLYAQQTIKGIVRDNKGNPLNSISILVKGTNVGTATNQDGAYSLSLPMRPEER